MKYIILTGALKNVGDFLIADRAKKLISYHKPDAELIDISRYDSLENKLDIINSANAVILAGGPGYSYDMYPGVFKLTDDLNKVKVPIICMAMGWYGSPGDDDSVYSYKYNNSSMELLKRSSDDFYLGCRDYLTERTLQNNNINNTLMTGCAAWYDMNYINENYTIRNDVKSVVFSNPASTSNVNQAIEVLKLIKLNYDDCKLYCAFHRGIDPDKFTSKKEAIAMITLKSNAESLGYEILDLSYDLEKMRIYDECDLHIGYRVHAHIYCISHYIKSILIEEDGRGRGVNNAIGLYGISARQRVSAVNVLENMPFNTLIIKVANKLGLATKNNKYAVKNLSNYISELKGNNYLNMENAFVTIKNTYKNMERFLREMP
ncbi:MAG: polysaccharide pyruvyl transferase family protein [Bacteroidales bacterium]